MTMNIKPFLLATMFGFASTAAMAQNDFAREQDQEVMMQRQWQMQQELQEQGNRQRQWMWDHSPHTPVQSQFDQRFNQFGN